MQSFVHGKFVQTFDEEAVALISSQGYESSYSKLLLRLTVLISDLVIYLPSCIYCALSLYRKPEERLKTLFLLVMNPALIIIDHGHFQYNGISIGLAAAAIGAVCQDFYLFSAVLFSLSLNHKQMSLYFAPALFAHLLGRCISQTSWKKRIQLFLGLGLAVVTTFFIVWAPFLTSLDLARAVLSRVFPTQRGLFEDYVANFWCVSSLVVKWKRFLSSRYLLGACTAATLLGFLPSFIMQIRKPSKKTLPLCMANTAFSFYLFSYQVHEKSILLPLLPICLLQYEGDVNVTSILNAAMISMFPLLKKDNLLGAYFGLLLLTNVLFPTFIGNERVKVQHENRFENLLYALIRVSPLQSFGITLAVHVLMHLMPSSARYPYLKDALMVSWAFLHFVILFVYNNVRHIRLYLTSNPSVYPKSKNF